MKKSSGEIYCLAPWVHAYVNTLGKRDLCCFKDFSLEKVQGKDLVPLDEFWNGQEMREIRLEMLKGEAPSSCYPCSSKVLYNDHPRNFFFDKYSALKEEAAESTDESGATRMRPQFLDYRFSNICNFSCRMCSPGSSSKIEAIERKLRPNDFDKTSFKDSRFAFNSAHVIPEFKDLISSGQIDQLYWGGGEPLLTEEHWSLMEHAVDCGKSSEIDVTYNTNLSVLSYRNLNLPALVSKFKDVKFLVSLDGVGKVGEYIREGMSWDKMKENLKSISSIENASLKLTITITLPGLLFIEELAEFIKSNNFDYEIHICHANGPHDLMTPLILPRDILSSLVDKKVSEIKELNSSTLGPLVKNLELIKERKVVAEEYPENFEKRFIACRNHFLEKEPKGGIGMKTILSRYPEVCDSWFRFYKEHVLEPNFYERKFIELQGAKLFSTKRVQQISTLTSAVNYFLEDKNSVSIINSFEQIESDHILITNDPLIEELGRVGFDELAEKMNKGDLLSLVVPAENSLNKLSNRGDLDRYLSKVKLDLELKKGIKGFEIIEKQSIPPWEFLFFDKPLFRPFRILGKTLDVIIRSELCLHRHWVLKKL